MNASQCIFATLRGVSNNKIVGKKRLQKILHLLKLSGADVDFGYQLHRYGPYSFELANAADMLSAFGGIRENQEPIGVYGTYQSVYSLLDQSDVSASEDSQWGETEIEILKFLEQFSTIELEISSTIGYFLSIDNDLENSISETKYMKPNIATLSTIKIAKVVLNRLGIH